MVKNGKLLSVITLILLLCFTFTSFIACSKTDNSANKPTVEQTEQTSDDESTDSEEQSPDSEEQTSDSSGRPWWAGTTSYASDKNR